MIEAYIVKDFNLCEGEFEEVQIERESVKKGLLVKSEEIEVFIGIPSVIQIDTGGYLSEYEKQRRATIGKSLKNSIIALGHSLYTMLYFKHEESENMLGYYTEVQKWVEPYTEVKIEHYYIPQHNIYVINFDTLFEIGRGKMTLKEYERVYIPPEYTLALDNVMKFVESLRNVKF